MMQAGVYRGIEDIRVETVETPEPGSKDVIVEVGACGICGTDLHVYRKGAYVQPGQILGHEFSGVVATVGDEVEGIEPGQRVVVNPMMNMIGLGAPGGFSQFVKVKNGTAGANVIPIPDGVSDEAGALVEPFAVGLHGVNRVQPQPSDKVAIFGAGTIGLVTLVAMKAAGVEEVVVTDVSPLRLDVAKQLGASDVFNPATDGSTTAEYLKARHGVSEMSGMQFAATDITVDCAGVPQTFLDAVGLVRFGGKALILAAYEEPATFDPSLFITKEVSVIGSLAYTDEFHRAIELLASGEVDLAPLISHRFSLAELPQAFEQQTKADEAIKVMVVGKS